MIITRLKLSNWRNFTEVDVPLRDRAFIIGPNDRANRICSMQSGFFVMLPSARAEACRRRYVSAEVCVS